MKIILLSLATLLLTITITAQKNNIHLKRVFCDTLYNLYDMHENVDGSFIGVGSFNQNPAGVYTADRVIVKLDQNYNIVWTKKYGGTQIDYFQRIRKINDNRYILGGYAASIDGDLTAYSWPFPTAANIWLMIVDSNGNFIHGNTYGYGSYSGLSDIEVRSDGGIFVTGNSVAEYGDFASTPAGFLQYQNFIAYTDTLLTKKWLRFIDAGPSQEAQISATTLDQYENLICGINTNSTLGEFAGLGPTKHTDAFLFWIDTNQTILRRIKKSGTDSDLLNALETDSNGNLYWLVNTADTSGDFHTPEAKFGPAFSNYLCLLKTDSIGNTIWKHAFGSFDTTILESRSVQPNSQSLLLHQGKIWMSARINGRDSIGEGFGWVPNLGEKDVWVLQCDSIGILENKRRIGGTNFDLSNWIKANKKNNKVISGIQTGLAPFGDDGFKCCGTAGEDFKIFELEQWPTSVSNINKGLNLVWTISPNPTNGTLQVNFEKEFSGTLAVKDVEGKEVLVVNLKKALRKELQLNHLPNGTYYINISNKQGRQVKKVILRK